MLQFHFTLATSNREANRLYTPISWLSVNTNLKIPFEVAPSMPISPMRNFAMSQNAGPPKRRLLRKSPNRVGRLYLHTLAPSRAARV